MAYKAGDRITVNIENFHVPYVTPPIPALEQIEGYGLPPKEQKWRRPILPTDDEAKRMPQAEKMALIEREFRRRLFGFWFMNYNRKTKKSEPTYITGSHYFTLTYWFMAAVNEDGYPEYRRAARIWFYVIDICDNDDYCAGCIMMTSKRFGKTEYSLSDIYNKSTLIYEEDLFGLQSLNGKEAKDNLFRGRLMRSHVRIPNYLKPVSNETGSKKEIVTELNFKGENLGQGQYKKGLNNTISWRPTLVNAFQGKRPRRVFLDEPGSVEEMDIYDWWTTLKQQLTLGKKFYGKAYLPTTLETMKPKGAPLYQKLWDESDPSKRDANGKTESGLYRYFKAQQFGREDFIDEYGDDLDEEAREFRANELANATPENQRKIKRQYPETPEEAFDLDFGGRLSAEASAILKTRRDEIRANQEPRVPYTIFEYGGHIKLEPAKYESSNTVTIFEHPKPHVKYKVSVDGTGTDKRTSDSKKNQSKKSAYAVVVTKLVDPEASQKSYCDVAEYLCEPDDMDQDKCFRMTLLLTKYYNTHGECTILPEGNVGTAPAIVGYFENFGALRLMEKQPKYPGSDNKEVLNRYCFYRDGVTMDTQLFLLNVACKMYGHNFNSIRLIDDLLATGTRNTDLGSAFQGCLLMWGGFHNLDRKAELPTVHSVTKFRYNRDTRQYEEYVVTY